MSLPFHAGSSRSSHVAGSLPPTSLVRRSVLAMKPKMPVYQPGQKPPSSLNSGCARAGCAERSDLNTLARVVRVGGNAFQLDPPPTLREAVWELGPAYARSVIDLAIIAAVAAGAFFGFRKGFIVPLVVQAGGLIGLWAVYAGPLKGSVPSGIAGAGLRFGALALASTVFGMVARVLVSLIPRFPILKKFDKSAGVPLGAATAVLTVYVALLGVVTLDGWPAP